jgi:hypothetical protein
MDVGKAIYNILSNDADVSLILRDGPNFKIFPARYKFTTSPALPFLVYQVVSDLPNMTKNGVSTYDYVSVQITMVHSSYSKLIDLSNKVRTALDYVSGTFEGVVVDKIFFENSNEIYDDNSGTNGLYQIAHDYRFNIDRSVSTEFDLNSINNLQLWLKKGTGITTDGGNVSNWTSSSLNAYQMIQTSSAAQPVHDASTDIVQFTNARQLNLTSNGTDATNIDFPTGAITFIVVLTASTNLSNPFQIIAGDGDTKIIQFFAPGDFFYLDSITSLVDGSSAGDYIANGEKLMLTWTYAGGTNGAVDILKNGTSIGLTIGATGTTGSYQINQLGVDGGAGTRGMFSGIHEIAIFNSLLNAEDLTNAQNDIKERNGIS